MKAICKLLLLAVIFSAGTVQAQIEVSIEEKVSEMSQGEQNGFTVLIENGNLKDVEKELRKHFKEYKGKVTGSIKEELLFDDANMTALSENTIDVYVKMFEVGNDVKLMTFWDLGGTYINAEAHPEKAELVNGKLRKFAVHYQRVLVEEKLREEEKSLTKKENTLKDLIKTNEKLHDKIESNKRDIERTKKDIADNEVDQDRKREEIANQKDIVAKLMDSPGEEKDLADKRLKELEKDKKKLQKDNERMHQKISDMENAISEAERDIQTNLEDQRNQTEDIEEQRTVVTKVQEELSRIK